MSIATQTGDDGTTGLLFNRRVSKDHPRVEAYGACDELNTALGAVRAGLGQPPPLSEKIWMHDQLLAIQKNLVNLMAELATLPEDHARYLKAGHHFVTEEDVDRLTRLVSEIEAQNVSFKGWATPGSTPIAALLDVARSVCRRAERRVVTLHGNQNSPHPLILKYLNRLSDLLWLMARKAETRKI